MYVRSPISTSSITKGKLYKVRELNGDSATIINDCEETCNLYLPSCAHIGNAAWEIVFIDQLTGKETQIQLSKYLTLGTKWHEAICKLIKEKETPMTDKRTPAEIVYDAAIESLNLKVGDIATVTARWPTHSLSWKNSWVADMDKFVGKRCIVGEISLERKGIQLFWDGDFYWFPPYVLKKLADAPKKPEPAPTPEDELMASDVTLRDYFAAQALTDLAYGNANLEETATRCYTLADAMLEARKKK